MESNFVKITRGQSLLIYPNEKFLSLGPYILLELFAGSKNNSQVFLELIARLHFYPRFVE